MKIDSRLTSVIVAILLSAKIYELSTHKLSLKPDVENEETNQNYVAGSTTAVHDQSPFLQNRGNNDPTGGAECLDLDLQGSMDTIISNHEQIFIIMPPKAAGTTMKNFTKQCTKRNLIGGHIVGNGAEMENLLTDSLEVPSIISSRILDDQQLIDTAKHLSSGTLLIYIHRDETDRLVSAIHHVLLKRLCTEGQYNQHNEIMMKNKTHCILNEDLVVQNIIKQRKNELQNDVLSCKAYEVLEQHDPNLIFIHYKQVNKLQKLLTKNHCPELLNEPPVEKNVGKDKRREMQVHIKLKNENLMVTLVDWLKEKKHLLEWSLKLRHNADCKGKTKHMQTDLFNCADETLRVVDGSSLYKQW